jgi:hypothetical protein
MAADALAVLIPSVTRAAAATTNGSTYDFRDYFRGRGGLFTAELRISAISGTTPTLAVKIQGSDDGTNWQDVVNVPNKAVGATSTAVNAIGAYPITWIHPFRYARAVDTVTGTGPSITFEMPFTSSNP